MLMLTFIILKSHTVFQMASMKMFQIQFHTGFVPRNATTVKFAKYVFTVWSSPSSE